MSEPKVHEVKRISSHQSYHGWPTIARLQNGELLVVVSAGREGHVCPFGQVHLIRSTDNGETWSGPEILVNGPLDDRDAGILQTGKGAILVNWFTSIAWLRRLEQAEAGSTEDLRKFGDDAYLARCRKVRSLYSMDLIGRELGTWLLRSTDGGKTWSEKIDCGVGSPHGPTELADGRILFVGNWKHEELPNMNGSPYSKILGASVSDDDGLTWRRLGAIPQRPGDEPGTYHEPHAVQASDGRIVVHIRNHSEQDKGHILQSESSDGGETFSVPRDTGVIGLPAHLLRLRDGRLLTTYGYRAMPFGNRAAISEDGGKTWSEPIVLDEKPVARDIGYPSSAELDDGSVLSVWYEAGKRVRDKKLPGDEPAQLYSAHWSLS